MWRRLISFQALLRSTSAIESLITSNISTTVPVTNRSVTTSNFFTKAKQITAVNNYGNLILKPQIPFNFSINYNSIVNEPKRSFCDTTAGNQSQMLNASATDAGRQLMAVCTCKKCNARQQYSFSHHSYTKGVVIVRCPGCKNLHLIADNLEWFGAKRNLESIAKEKGRSFTYISNANSPQQADQSNHAKLDATQILNELASSESKQIEKTLPCGTQTTFKLSGNTIEALPSPPH